VSTEFAVAMTAFLTAFMLLVVFAGRVASAENHVRSAADEAARAASLAGDPTTGDTQARLVAQANLTTAGLTCSRGLAVAVDLGDFRPGGTVSVTITCTASFGDLAPLAVPGTRTFTATATEVIDTYRSDA
jgi:Flp pilus assembly protein TadG